MNDQKIRAGVEYSTGETWTRPSDGKVFPVMKKLFTFNGWDHYTDTTRRTFHRIRGIAGAMLKVDYAVLSAHGQNDTDWPLSDNLLEVVTDPYTIRTAYAGFTDIPINKIAVMVKYPVDPDSVERRPPVSPQLFTGIDPKNIELWSTDPDDIEADPAYIHMTIKNSKGKNTNSIMCAGFNQETWSSGNSDFENIVTFDDAVIDSDNYVIKNAYPIPPGRDHFVLALKSESEKIYETRMFFFLTGHFYPFTKQAPEDRIDLYEAPYIGDDGYITVNGAQDFYEDLFGIGPALTPANIKVGLPGISVYFTNSKGLNQKFVKLLELTTAGYNADSAATVSPHVCSYEVLPTDYETAKTFSNNSGKTHIVVIVADDPAAPNSADCKFYAFPKSEYASAKINITDYEVVDFPATKPNLTAVAMIPW